ncbi:MAG TPA: Mu-like prophage major head subunit gpT family protein [Methanothrix sp.]|nr:Mu-like prophage major head subunit gpT family protein [Methanothrix sp.]HOK59037.1 Mu-like prophage major head subunit gpT family protein [Methanothrix sp.]HOL44304.1 Mu-like prophage major head subunit gpT family protein [Methanothrix sp.]HPO89293.1 Mu-like prophage major head subunit gpT family protein [Methanothrix sp.]
MATEARSRFNKLYVPGLFLVATDSYKRYSEDWREFILVQKTSRSYEEIATVSGLGLMAKKPEGTAIFYDARIQGPSKKFVVETWGLGVRITEEAIEDDLYGVMKQAMKELGISAAETINCEAYNGFNLGASSKTSADGEYIFSSSHSKLDGSTYSNYYTATSLSLDALQDDILAFESLTDHTGKKINRTAGVRYILANPALEWKLTELLGSQMNPETGNNAVNALVKARPKIKFHCTPYITSTTARYYIGELDEARGMVWFNRKAPTFAREGDFDTGDVRFKVTARFAGAGSVDPMNIACNPGA